MAVTAPRNAHFGVAGASEALWRGRDHLLRLQHPDGWWKGELQTNVTMDAEDLLLREFLGVREPEATAAAARWIRSQQRGDGSWATFHGGPGDLSTTVEAYVALRLAGDPPERPHMRAAAAFARAAGGLAGTRVFTRLWLALGGLWPWDDLPATPPEVVLLGPRVPFNIYDFACWARQTIVAVTVVGAHRPVWPLPFRIDELRAGPRPVEPAAGLLAAAERLLRRYDRRPLRRVRRAALARAERWIVEHQEADGSWGGIQPPWVYSLLALHARGYAVDHPVMRAGLEGFDRFVLCDERGRRLEACQSPVWDTALAVVALADAGVPGDDPALRRAADWLLDQEVRTRGDWAVRRPALAPSGWPFEFANATYPDIDDTAEVVLALRRVEHPDRTRVDAAVRRATAWVTGMQSRGGGWGAFDADNVRARCRDLAFCDFGAVIDDPSADVTAHVIEMLAGEPARGALERGLAWLTREQEPDGPWYGRWGVNYVYGVGAALPALAAAGVPPADPRMRAAVAWLERHQNPDGGWGEDCRSYSDPAWIGRGTSTPSQTAWALLALHAAGERSAAAARGVAWLVAAQRPDGGWDEPQFTGTGFPGDFFINYHLYRAIFPVMALGRWLQET